MDTQFDLDVPLKDWGKAGWRLWRRRSGRKNKFHFTMITLWNPGKIQMKTSRGNLDIFPRMGSQICKLGHQW